MTRIVRRATSKCNYERCDRWAWARGYCGAHYQELRRAGKMPVVRPNVGKIDERFDASYKINPDTDCWEWIEWRHGKGYGVLTVGGERKKVRAHRYAYERFVGSIPTGMLVCHKCGIM